MSTAPKHRFWRWLALFAVVANVAFNYLSQSALAFGDDLRVVTERYDALFRPADYAFVIWGVIYAGFVAYAVYALRPSQRDVRLHDTLAIPLVVANALAALWIVAFRYDHIGTSATLMLAEVLTAITLYARSRPASPAYAPLDHVSRLVGVPFSLFLAWVSVACIAAFATYVRSVGIDEIVLGEATWAAFLLVVAGFVSVVVAVRYRDGLVPAVVSWASFAIWLSVRGESPSVGRFAVGVGIFTATAATYLVACLVTHRPRIPTGRYETPRTLTAS